MSEYVGNEKCECGCDDIRFDSIRNECVCKKCGLVIEDCLIEANTRNVKFSLEGKLDIDVRRKDDLGSFITGKCSSNSAEDNAKWKRMQTIQKNSVNENQRAFYKAKATLEQMCSLSEVSQSVQDRILAIYEGASEKKLTRGKPLKVTLCAAMYQAFKEVGGCRSADEIAKTYRIGKKDVFDSWKKMRDNLGWDRKLESPETYLMPMAGKLKMKPEGVAYARKMIRAINGHNSVNGMSPKSISAGCLYKADLDLNLGFNQSDIIAATGVCGPTLRDVTMKLENLLA